MNIESLLQKVETAPESLEFTEVIQIIGDNYAFNPTNFQCGSVKNESGSNEGSCKILAFAKMHNISEEKTPYLFGHFYRDDVLKNSDGEDHGNIRSFLKNGWGGVSFESSPLEKL